jgi:hypothetical protein
VRVFLGLFRENPPTHQKKTSAVMSRDTYTTDREKHNRCSSLVLRESVGLCLNNVINIFGDISLNNARAFFLN